MVSPPRIQSLQTRSEMSHECTLQNLITDLLLSAKHRQREQSLQKGMFTQKKCNRSMKLCPHLKVCVTSL